ncbi:hypothetical protein [Tichowtungia aerotolerans]|uniref:DUF1080 domain-containing protein n=1 Tax=Tichowtungia aerotolerans TaxID=2697043 RepID=A0A6P1MAF0_9BACT|nr:hypothetical protein [Tichowtungia aerotolerans]QHI68546.1 hypothetical protein GT409_03450 [Tichowtungia aerotolerans]
MKKFLMIAAVSFAACAGHAGVVTNFYADFEVLNSGGPGTLTNAAQVNAGTPVGSWIVTDAQESLIFGGAAGFDQGEYDFTANCKSGAQVANGVTITFDMRSRRDGFNKYNAIRIKNEAGLNAISLRWSGTADGVSGQLEYWVTGTGWVVAANDIFLANDFGFASGITDRMTISLSSAGYDVAVNGAVILEGMEYAAVPETIQSMQFFGDGVLLGGAWYDTILVTSGLAPEGYAAHFNAEFNVPDSGGEGTLTAVEQLDAGTEVGSWVLADAQESFIFNGAVGFDQGLYNVTANLASNAAVKDGVVFHADIRSKRDGATKWNGIRIKNESGLNVISLRWTGTADGVSGSLEYWNGAWVSLGNNILMANDFWFTSGLTDHLQVQMRETDYDILLNGTSLLSNAAYENEITSVGSVQFFGINDFSGAWYDSIRVLKADALPDQITEIGSISMGLSSADDVELSWTAEAVGTYVLQTRTDLLTGAWSNLVEGIAGIDGTLSVTTTPTAATAFYRIVGE